MKTKNQIQKITALVLTLLFLSSNISKAQTIINGTFNNLKVEGRINVTIQAADVNSLELIKAGNTSTLEESVSFKIKNNELIISGNDGHEAEVLLKYIQLDRINIATISNVKSNNVLKTNNLQLITASAADLNLEVEAITLNLKASGASTVKLTGKVDVFEAELSGAADLLAPGLVVKDAKMNISGAADAFVNVENSINAKASGVSNITLLNKPADEKIDISGVASVSYGERSKKSKISDNLNKISVGTGTSSSSGASTSGDTKIKKKKFDGHWGGIELGLNNFVSSNNKIELPAQYDYLELRQAKSTTVQLNLFEQNLPLISNNLGLVTGLGWWFNNYRFENNVVLSSDSATIFGYRSTSNKYSKSKLGASYLVVPLMLEYQSDAKKGKTSFHIAAGGFAGVRITSRTKIVYESNGNTQKVKTPADFHLNQFKYGLTARVGWSKFNFFANYNMSTLFKNNKGPELYPVEVGITLLSF